MRESALADFPAGCASQKLLPSHHDRKQFTVTFYFIILRTKQDHDHQVDHIHQISHLITLGIFERFHLGTALAAMVAACLHSHGSDLAVRSYDGLFDLPSAQL